MKKIITVAVITLGATIAGLFANTFLIEIITGLLEEMSVMELFEFPNIFPYKQIQVLLEIDFNFGNVVIDWIVTILVVIIMILSSAFCIFTVWRFTKSHYVEPSDWEEYEGTEYTVTKTYDGKYEVKSKDVYSGGCAGYIWNIVVFLFSWLFLTVFGFISFFILLMFKKYRNMSLLDFYFG